MRSLAQRLIAEEHRLGDSADSEGRAAFGVCSKLHGSLTSLVGMRGFRTLLMRALTLAKADAAWLGRLEVGADGALVFPPGLEREVEAQEIAKGGGALVTRMLELLETLVGEALTLRLMQKVWPKAALGGEKPERKK